MFFQTSYNKPALYVYIYHPLLSLRKAGKIINNFFSTFYPKEPQYNIYF